MYAIFVTGGKQYKASVDDILYVEKLDAEAGESVSFDQVLIISNDSGLRTGAPFIDGAKVLATVEKNGKAKKIKVFKYKAKKGYRRLKGHRQPYTKIKINSING